MAAQLRGAATHSAATNDAPFLCGCCMGRPMPSLMLSYKELVELGSNAAILPVL